MFVVCYLSAEECGAKNSAISQRLFFPVSAYFQETNSLLSRTISVKFLILRTQMTSRLGLHLNRRSSFLSIFRSQEFTWIVSQSLLTSPTFRVINPLSHPVTADKVSIKLPVPAVSGLRDEEILALLTKGYFGEWVFAFEGWVMRTCGGIVSANFESM